jgi:hypothetical protein
MTLYYSKNRSQAKPRASSHLLCREKWFKDKLLGLIVHPDARISDRQLDIISGLWIKRLLFKPS